MPLIEEEIVDCEKLARLSRDAVLFYLLLRLKADPYGRFHANPALLNSRLYPLRKDIRDTLITRWLTECRTAGMLHCYTDSRGRAILEIFNARQRLKFMKSDFDPPGGQQNFSLPSATEVEAEVEGKEKRPAPPVKTSAGPDIIGKNQHAAKPDCRRREVWQCLRDEKELSERIRRERESTKPDETLIASLKKSRATVREEMKTA